MSGDGTSGGHTDVVLASAAEELEQVDVRLGVVELGARVGEPGKPLCGGERVALQKR